MTKNLKNRKEKIEANKGITLIALVITIIVLLILAGVSIAMLTGENGILTQAQNAKNKTAEAEVQEIADLDKQNTFIENLASGGSIVKPGEPVDSTSKNNYIDQNGDKATVPAGFTVSGIESEQKISEGLVIYDIPEGTEVDWTTQNEDGAYQVQTLYNQFVWIPVASETDYQRDLSYPSYYGSSSETTPEDTTFTDESGYLPDGIKPETENSENNENAERTAVLKYNGFYIGRYEAGKDTDNITVVSKQSATIWTNIKQVDSETTAKTMYNNNTVKSALCSGIQWDMVMHFVDKKNDVIGKVFDVRVYDSTRHTGNVEDSGKNNNDKVQNIYDLEGNYLEWVAEKNNTSDPFIRRGGFYVKDSNYSASRRGSNVGIDYSNFTFRPALYII